jgi:hypothetical protein
VKEHQVVAAITVAPWSRRRHALELTRRMRGAVDEREKSHGGAVLEENELAGAPNSKSNDEENESWRSSAREDKNERSLPGWCVWP